MPETQSPTTKQPVIVRDEVALPHRAWERETTLTLPTGHVIRVTIRHHVHMERCVFRTDVFHQDSLEWKMLEARPVWESRRGLLEGTKNNSRLIMESSQELLDSMVAYATSVLK